MNQIKNYFTNTKTTDYCLDFLEAKIRDLSVELTKLYQCGAIADNKELIEKSQELDRYIVLYLKKNATTS